MCKGPIDTVTYQRDLGYKRSLGKGQEHLVASGGKAETSPMNGTEESIADASRIVNAIIRQADNRIKSTIQHPRNGDC